MQIKNAALKLILCPARNPEARYFSVYQKIYKCWHDVWGIVFEEMKIIERRALKSDGFTRHDFVAAVFSGEECIAFALYKYIDLHDHVSVDDPFLARWDDSHRTSTIKSFGHRLLICANLGVDPKFRNRALGFSLSELMGGLNAALTLHSRADAVLGTPRIDLGINKVCYRWGATPIAINVDWGSDINVDLVAFYKPDIETKKDHEMWPLVSELWKNKLIVPDATYEKLSDFEHPIAFDYQTEPYKRTG